MRRTGRTLVALGLAGGLVGAGAAAADVIHLKNGNRVQVDAWRDVGDAIEFARLGGVVRIPKTEIERIDGRPTRGGLPMYPGPAREAPPAEATAPVPAALAGPLAEPAGRMLGLLDQSVGLLDNTDLFPDQRAGALRRLVGEWRNLDVPSELQEAYAQGERAVVVAFEAANAEDLGGGSRQQVENAKNEIAAAREAIRKAAAGRPPGQPGASPEAPPGQRS